MSVTNNYPRQFLRKAKDFIINISQNPYIQKRQLTQTKKQFHLLTIALEYVPNTTSAKTFKIHPIFKSYEYNDLGMKLKTKQTPISEKIAEHEKGIHGKKFVLNCKHIKTITKIIYLMCSISAHWPAWRPRHVAF